MLENGEREKLSLGSFVFTVKRLFLAITFEIKEN